MKKDEKSSEHLYSQSIPFSIKHPFELEKNVKEVF